MCKVQLGCRVLFQSPTGASDPWRSGGVQWGKYARKHQGQDRVAPPPPCWKCTYYITVGAPCREETLLQVDPEWPAGGVCRVSDARPEVLDAAITITEAQKQMYWVPRKSPAKKRGILCQLFVKEWEAKLQNHAKCNNAPRYVNAINANEDVVEM